MELVWLGLEVAGLGACATEKWRWGWDENWRWGRDGSRAERTNVPAWSVSCFYLMVRRRGIKCVHLPNLFLSDGSMEGRH